MDINIEFNSLSHFYRESEIISENDSEIGNYSRNYITDTEEESFRGLSNKEILDSKYSYTKGLDQLKELDLDIFIGGSKKEYKLDSFDGDDMIYEKYIEGDPCMKKRIKASGTGNGKFITIYINLSEAWCIEYKDLLFKSYAVMRFIDYIESMNYRTKIVVCWKVFNCIRYNGEEDNTLFIKIPIKQFNEPLIKGNVLTCISPWMLRYHLFNFVIHRFTALYGLGVPTKFIEESTKENIYFDSGECLDKGAAERKFEKIKKLFDKLFGCLLLKRNLEATR